MIELRGRELCRRFGGVMAVDCVDIRVRSGEIVGICGPNGAGKTSLFDLLTGFSSPDYGEITLHADGRSRQMTGSATRFARLGVLRTFQQIRLYGEETVADNVRLAALGCGKPQTAIPEILDRLGISALAEQRAGALSYGNRRLVEIARALAGGSRLLFLDEPAAGMSEWEAAALSEKLRQFRDERDLGVVVIEHDLQFLNRLCDRAICMAEGKILGEGTPAAVFSDAAVRRELLGEEVAGC